MGLCHTSQFRKIRRNLTQRHENSIEQQEDRTTTLNPDLSNIKKTQEDDRKESLKVASKVCMPPDPGTEEGRPIHCLSVRGTEGISMGAVSNGQTATMCVPSGVSSAPPIHQCVSPISPARPLARASRTPSHSAGPLTVTSLAAGH